MRFIWSKYQINQRFNQSIYVSVFVSHSASLVCFYCSFFRNNVKQMNSTTQSQRSVKNLSEVDVWFLLMMLVYISFHKSQLCKQILSTRNKRSNLLHCSYFLFLPLSLSLLMPASWFWFAQYYPWLFHIFKSSLEQAMCKQFATSETLSGQRSTILCVRIWIRDFGQLPRRHGNSIHCVHSFSVYVSYFVVIYLSIPSNTCSQIWFSLSIISFYRRNSMQNRRNVKRGKHCHVTWRKCQNVRK